MAAMVLAACLGMISPAWAIVPLAIFLLLCAVAPFLPGVSFFLPIISRGTDKETGVTLSFDDGPHPQSTPVILELLTRHNCKATFFIVAEQAAKYPELVHEILARGHTIGNHSLRHDSLLMLRSPRTIALDIRRAQEILQRFGVRPLLFRPPVAITNPRLGRILEAEGLVAVNYSCRAFDRGNRNIVNLATRILDRVRPGDIIMLHDLPPHRPDVQEEWHRELDQLLDTLHGRYRVVPLARLIRRPVMSRPIQR